MTDPSDNTEFDDLLEGLNQALDFAGGATDGFRAHVPTTVDVRAIRETTGLTQERFAHAFGIGVATLRQWEQGRRAPRGPARVLLRVIEREPAVILRALHDPELEVVSK